MWMALVKKELREIAPIAAFGLGVQSLMVASLMDPSGRRYIPLVSDFLSVGSGIPFIADGLLFPFVVFSILTLGLIAFRQFAWERHQGTYPFLFHRPMSRTAIFSTKILCGYGGFLLVTGIPMLVYAVWAATPGNVPGPFHWSMTEPFVRTLLVLFIPYLAASITILREARWFGTRLFPLIGGIAVTIPLAMLPFSQPPVGVGMVLALAVLLFVLNQSVVRSRDFS